MTEIADVDPVIEEIARDAATQAETLAAEEADKEVAEEEAVKRLAEEEAAKEAAAKAAEEEAAKRLAGDQPSSSETPSSSHYIKVGKNAVSMPGSASIQELVEGQQLDGEIVTTTASGEPTEEQLLRAFQESFQKLRAFQQARKEKLDSRAAIIETAEGDFQQRLKETRDWYKGALQELTEYQQQLAKERDDLLLERSDLEKAREEAAHNAAAVDAHLTERRIGLDAQEEDLIAREATLDARLRGKDEELEGLVARRVQELEQSHTAALAALTENHAGKLKEALDAAGAAEAARNSLEEKAKQLEATLEEHGKRITALEAEREKTLHSLSEMQVAMSEKIQQLASANNSIEDLKLKLTTLQKSLEAARAHEKTLAKELHAEQELLKNAYATHQDYVTGTEVWTARLVDVAGRLAAELEAMKLEGFGYSANDRISESAKITMFFEGLVDALKQLQATHDSKLASECKKLCQDVVQMLLMKVAYRNPGVDFSKIFSRLPKDANAKALEELVAPIVERIGQVKRVEGDRQD